MRLTKTSVAALEITGKRYEVVDDNLKGFYIRINAGGTKTPIVRYYKDGRLRAVTLKPLSDAFSFAKAKERATEILAEVALGGDPAGDKQAGREAATFAEIGERFIREHAVPYCKPSTAKKYEQLLERHLVPAFGRMPIASLTRANVERLHQEIGKETPGQANRVLQLCSSICGKAEDWGHRPQQSNPCHRVRKFHERRLERFLSAVERARLDESLTVAEKAVPGAKAHVAPGAITAIRLLSLTGCRVGEIVDLEWPYVDLERGFLRLPDSKTREKIVPLSAHAVAFLTSARKDSRSHLVCPSETGGALGNIERAWRSIRSRANLDDVRLHDLRHSFASDALAAHVDLKTIGLILGHKSVSTTERYAHLAPGTLRDGVNAAGAQVAQQTADGHQEREDERKDKDGGTSGEDAS